MKHKRFIIVLGIFIVSIWINLLTENTCAKAYTITKTKQGSLIVTPITQFNRAKVAKNKLEKSTDSVSGRENISRGNVNLGSSIVAYSYNFLGKPYAFGAAGPKAFDCSGLTQYVFAKFGIALPHYTGSQFAMGTSVLREELQQGDLVFFNTYGAISHVGIYVGSGGFIHAPSSGRTVKVSSLSESYYASRYAGARRVK